MKMQKALTLGLIVLAAPLLTSGSRAGDGDHYAGCSKNADGSGGCFGTWRDFRNSAGTTNNFYFSQFEDGSKFFGATWAGVQYTCRPNAATAAGWALALTFTSYINIGWDASGTCNFLFQTNGSWARDSY